MKENPSVMNREEFIALIRSSIYYDSIEDCGDAELIIYEEIRMERERQNRKWGEQNHDPLYWLAILGEEFGEVSKALIEHSGQSKVEKELVEVAAVAVAFIDSMRRQKSLDRERARDRNYSNHFFICLVLRDLQKKINSMIGREVISE